MLWFFKTEQLLVGIGIGQLYASSSMAIEPRPATQHITSEPVFYQENRYPSVFEDRGSIQKLKLCMLVIILAIKPSLSKLDV